MKAWLLENSALLTLRDNEPGAERVAVLLAEALEGRIARIGCLMSLMEILYRVWKD